MALTRTAGWNSAANLSTAAVTSASFTMSVGDIFVVGVAMDGNAAVPAVPTTTVGGITWTLKVSGKAAGYGTVALYTGTVTTAGTGTISVKGSASWVWSAFVEQLAGGNGVGTNAAARASTGNPGVSLTTSSQNSAVVIVSSDFNAIAGAATWGSVNGKTIATQADLRVANDYAAHFGYLLDAGATGTNTYGMTAPVDQAWNLAAVEITAAPDTSGTGTADFSGAGLLSARQPVPDITLPTYKEIALEITSTAENSTKDWTQAYAYIEDINDGRGYTGGLVGWTSGPGDMLTLVQYYSSIAPGNILEQYIDELTTITNSPEAQWPSQSHALLDPTFVPDWQSAAIHDPLFRQAQRDERDRMYWQPALDEAQTDAVGPLGLAIYYDISVNHGQGTDSQSFQGILIQARNEATPPSQGGDETTWLTKVIDLRSAVLTTWGDNPPDGRVAAHRALVASGNLNMVPTISWSMYGTAFSITSYPVAPIEVGFSGGGTLTASASLAQTASPTGIVSAGVFGTPVITKTLTASPAGIASGQVFGTAVITKNLTAYPPGIATSQALGAPSLTKTLTSSPAGIATAGAFGAPTVTQGLTVSPSSIGSAEAIGAPSLTANLTVSPAGLASGQAFGALNVSFDQAAGVTGIPSAGAMGTPTVQQLLTVTPDGIASEEAPGDVTLSTDVTAGPTGLASQAAFGSPTAAVLDPVFAAHPVGIPTAGAFGVPFISGTRKVTLVGVQSLQSFGSPKISNVLVAFPEDIPSDGNVFGAPTVKTRLQAAPAGIATREAFGAPTMVRVILMIGPIGIGSEELVAVPRIVGGAGLQAYEDAIGSLLERRYTGRLGAPENTSLKPNRWEGTLG